MSPLAASLRAAAMRLDAEAATLRAEADRLDQPAPVPSADDLLGRPAGVSAVSWRRAIATGALRGALVGRAYLVRRSDLDAWLASRRVQPAPPRQHARRGAAANDSPDDDAYDRALRRA